MIAATLPGGLTLPGLVRTLRQVGPTVLLLAGIAALSVAGISAARLLFIAGCAAVAWDALRQGARAHYAVSFVLFCTAPFLRRLVDVYAGYEASGLMLSGPMLAILVPVPRLVTQTGFEPALRPFVLAAACAFYATVLTLADGSFTLAASGALKWFAPILYGMWLFGEARRDPELIEPAVRVLMLLMPVLGIYGFVQYLDPPVWDRYWMNYTTIASIGQPEPFMVRVFSTMNAPAGYATFTAAALLLFGFRRARLGLLLAAAPSVLGLLLSLYRTAWVALAIGLIAGLLHPRTRGRSALMLAAVVVLGAAAMVLTPAGEMFAERLQTLGSVGEDESGQERLAEYSALLQADGGTLLGHGFENTDVMQAGALALDGQLVVSWFTMGLVVGLLCVTAVCWAGVQAVGAAWRSPSLSGVAISLVMVGALAQVPLATVSSSEIGFLFWSLAAVGAAMRVGSRPAVRHHPGARSWPKLLNTSADA